MLNFPVCIVTAMDFTRKAMTGCTLFPLFNTLVKSRSGHKGRMGVHNKQFLSVIQYFPCFMVATCSWSN